MTYSPESYIEEQWAHHLAQERRLFRGKARVFLLQGYRIEELEMDLDPYGDPTDRCVYPIRKLSRVRLALRRFVFGKNHTVRLAGIGYAQEAK